MLSSLYYNHKDENEKLYQTRIQSEESVHLNFKIGDYPAFYMETPELIRKVVEITRLDKEIALLSKQLPRIALRQYINKCLIDEIVITNNIEGVHSTRREIGEILDSLEEKNNRRFYGLVNKYVALLSGENLEIKRSQDIRKLYDEMFFSEVIEENPKDAPDGEIFRKEGVDIVNAAQKVIHEGVYPESEIIRKMDAALGILNDDSMEPLFRISIFHYLFGYIHPFYNGNGRMNRFISSYYLSQTLEPILGYRLSYTIKENVNRYYKGFKIVNDKVNRGDITPFIFVYLDFIKESALNLKEGLARKVNDLKRLSEQIPKLPSAKEEKFRKLYYVLLQASLFSEIGISTNELLKYLRISRPTLQKRLQEIEENNLLITEKREPYKFYQLNLENIGEC